MHSQSAPAEQVRDEETETPWFKKLPAQSQHFCPALPHGLFSTGLVDAHLYFAPSGVDDLPSSERPLCSLPTTEGPWPEQGWAGLTAEMSRMGMEDGAHGRGRCWWQPGKDWGAATGEGSMGERKVGEVQWKVSGVNEIFSSGGPERIAEIAEAEMINISQGKLPLGCFLHTHSTPTCTHTPPSSGSPKLCLHPFPGSS